MRTVDNWEDTLCANYGPSIKPQLSMDQEVFWEYQDKWLKCNNCLIMTPKEIAFVTHPHFPARTYFYTLEAWQEAFRTGILDAYSLLRKEVPLVQVRDKGRHPTQQEWKALLLQLFLR